MSEIKKVPRLKKPVNYSIGASTAIYSNTNGSKRLSQEQKLATDLAKPIANYAVAKLINFFINK